MASDYIERLRDQVERVYNEVLADRVSVDRTLTNPNYRNILLAECRLEMTGLDGAAGEENILTALIYLRKQGRIKLDRD